jgi:O-antigen ligase
MSEVRRLLKSRFWTHSRLFPVARGALYALVAGVLGWQLGRVLTSPSGDFVASLILVSVCVLITLQNPMGGLLLALILHPFVTFIYLNIDLGAGVPDITLGRVTIAITFTLILAKGATGWRPLLHLTWVDVCMVLATIGLGVAALRAVSITTEFQVMFDLFATPYMIYYVTKNLMTDRSMLKRVLWTLAFIGAYCAVYGIYTVMTGNVLFVGEGRLKGLTWYSENLRVMRGLLDSPHVFGLVFSLAIPVDFYLLIKARSRWTKLVFALILAVTMAGLFFTYKRTAWVATMASFLVIQFFFPRFRGLFLVLLILAGGVMALYWNQISESAVATERVGQKVDTLNGRLDLWDVALQGWRQKPIFGYGFGQFLIRSPIEVFESNYIWVLVDAGLVGFTPFILIFVLLLVTSVRLYRARASAVFVEPDLVAIFWGLTTAYLVSLFTVIMNHELPHALFFLVAGAVVGSQEAILNQHPNHQSQATKTECVDVHHPRVAASVGQGGTE